MPRFLALFGQFGHKAADGFSLAISVLHTGITGSLRAYSKQVKTCGLQAPSQNPPVSSPFQAGGFCKKVRCGCVGSRENKSNK
jgi:hypothetical protein